MQETADINLATYLRAVKNIPTVGHRFNGHQLLIGFDLTVDELRTYHAEYLNSAYARYDTTKRNFMQILKHSRG